MASWEGDYGLFGMTTGAFDMFDMKGQSFPTYEELMGFGGNCTVGNGVVSVVISDEFLGSPQMCAFAEITVEEDGDELPIAQIHVPLVDEYTGYERDEDTALREAYTELCEAVMWRSI